MNLSVGCLHSTVSPFLGTLVIFICVSCTQSPQIPELTHHENPNPEHILIGERISGEDVIEIFHVMNAQGDLSSIAYLFEDPEDHRVIADLVTKYLYEEAFLSQGWLEELDFHIKEKKFTVFREQVDRWVADDRFAHLVDVGNYLFYQKDFISLAYPFSGVLTEGFKEALEVFAAQAQNYHEKGFWPETEDELTATMWLTDLRQFVRSPKLSSALVTLGKHLRRESFLSYFLRGLSELWQKDFGHFEGFSRGLQHLLLKENQPDSYETDHVSHLDRLFKTAYHADSPTEGMFKFLRDRLNGDYDALNAAIELEPLVLEALSKSLTRYLQEIKDWTEIADSPIGVPNRAFVELFVAVLSAIEDIARLAEDTVTEQDYIANAPIFLNAYAITKMLQRVARQSRGNSLWESKLMLLPDSEFQVAWYRLGESGPEINLEFRKEFEALAKKRPVSGYSFRSLRRFQRYFYEHHLDAKEINVSSLRYNFSFGIGTGPRLEQYIEILVERTQSTLPYFNSAAVVRAIAFHATDPEETSFALTQLESDNILVQINEKLSVASINIFRKSIKPWVKRMLPFSDAFIRMFEIEAGYPRGWDVHAVEKFQTKVRELIAGVPSLLALDTELQPMPTAYETYHHILRSMPVNQQHSLTRILSFGGAHRLFSVDSEWTVKFPGLYTMALKGRPIGEILNGMGGLKEAHRKSMEGGLERILGSHSATQQTGLEAYLAHLKRLFAHKSGALQRVAEWIAEQGWALLEDLPFERASLRKLMLRFVNERDFEKLWRFFVAKVKPHQLFQFAGQLKELSKSGKFKTSLKALKRIRNDNLYRIAEVLERWDHSGELVHFLESIQKLLAPLVEGSIPTAQKFQPVTKIIQHE